MKTITQIIFLLAIAVAMHADGETISDEVLKDEILLFMRPIECVEMVRGQPHRPRVLTEKISFDGDTNRLARLLAELAQTNNAQIAQRSIALLGEYGTPVQLPFLYSCATNPAVGHNAIKTVMRIEGVNSNSLEVARSYLFATNRFSFDEVACRSDTCTDLLKNVFEDSGLAEFRPMMLGIATNFMDTVELMPNVLDNELCRVYDGFRFSKRRLAGLRSARQRDMAELLDATTNSYEVWRRTYCYTAQTNYLQNAINELVAYPEANLPD